MDSSPGRILIVDDERIACRFFEEVLAKEGYATQSVQTGEEALRQAGEFPPDLILLDAMMPVMSGFDVVAALKADERTRRIPVVMVTALEDQASRLRALGSGAEEFLNKPVHRLELLMRVKNLLKLKRYQDALAEESGQYRETAARRSDQLQAVNLRLDELQSQLLQSEKLASIGQLAAGVAHEINNPIGFVSSNVNTLRGYVDKFVEALHVYAEAEPAMSDEWRDRLHTLRERIDLDYLIQDVRQLINESQDGIARVRKIVQDLKDFSRADQQQQREFADLHHCLESTLTIATNEIKYKADVVREYGDIPSVECVPSLLNQVFLNMLVNAAQAIKGDVRGRITIRTGCDAHDAWVEIADTGSGIGAEDLKRIFEPFYTTKPPGIGTGLGLSVSYGIVKQHGGHIEVSSVVGEGTTMRIVLPRVQPAAAN